MKKGKAGRPRQRGPGELLQVFGQNVRLRRERMGLTQEELAMSCGIHRTRVGQMERGTVNATLATLQSLADPLECSEADLIRRPSK